MKKHLLLTLLGLLACLATLQAQQRTLTGKVTDQSTGQALPGVSVTIKGSGPTSRQRGTVTTADGTFSLNADNTNVLLFSFIGYNSTELAVGTREAVNVALEPSSRNLDEVVVVGYGTQKRATLTAAVTQLRREDLVVRQVATASNLLQGLAPGVTVTQQSGRPGADGASINVDLTNAFGPVKNGMGLLWSKYTLDDAQDMFISKTGFAYLRYAEILHTYAEAKIELNQVDASVTTAMNAVRKRAGMPSVATELVASQAKMRQLVRREKMVELANEGIHLFDMRRWGTGKLGLNTFVYGAPLARAKPAPIPSFGAAGSDRDLNDIPDYTNGDALRFKREQRTYLDRNALFPIPQRELDINKVLTQNQGW